MSQLAAGLAAILIAAAGIQTWRLHSAQADLATVRGQWASERAVQSAAAASAAQAARAEEQRRAAAQQEITDEALRTADRARADALSAAGAADGLRRRAAALAAACGAAAGHPAAAAGSATAAGPGDLLADVLSRVVVRAGQLAVIADQRGAAGSLCERSYDSLTPP